MASWSGKIALAIGVIIFGGLGPSIVAGQENAAANETVGEDAASQAEEKPKPVLTGIPQKDYIHDPNLPRELKGYDLSDYPFYKRVPDVNFNFSCENRHDGFYASIPHKCQVYHHCLFGERFDFLCANYTAFDQATFICHFANRVDCANSELYFDRNDALYKAESTTTTPPPPPQIKIVYVDRPAPRAKPRPKKQRPNKQPTYDYYDYYENEEPARESTSAQPDYYYDYYEDEITTKPTTTSTTTTTTRRSVRKRLPRPRPQNQGSNPRRSGNKRNPQSQTNQPPSEDSNRPQRVRQQGQNNPRRRRPNKSQGNQPGRMRRRRKKKTTTTTTTTTAQPEYYDDYEYYDYYYDDQASVTSTTKAPATSGRVSLEERRRNLLKSRKSKLQQITRPSLAVEATPSTAPEGRVLSTEAEYDYQDPPNTRRQNRGRRRERQGSSKQSRSRRLRSQTPVE